MLFLLYKYFLYYNIINPRLTMDTMRIYLVKFFEIHLIFNINILL